jgi:ribosomal protein S24E
MKIDIRKEHYNRLLKRKEIMFSIDHIEEATPSMAAVQQLLAKQLGAGVDKTEIKEIQTLSGSPESECTAFLWEEKTVKDMSIKEEKKEGNE